MSSRPPLVACWLDKSIGEPNTHLDLKNRAQRASDRINEWQYFDCGDTFREFIKNNPNIQVVAIMSGGFAKQQVTPLSHLSTLHSVYVFCGNVDKHQTLMDTEPKVKGVFNSEDQLFEQMRADLQRAFP